MPDSNDSAPNGDRTNGSLSRMRKQGLEMALTTEPVVSRRRGLWSLRAKPAGPVTNLAEVADIAALDDPAVRPRRRSWGVRYASKVTVTDILALVLASLAVHVWSLPTLEFVQVGEPAYL